MSLVSEHSNRGVVVLDWWVGAGCVRCAVRSGWWFGPRENTGNGVCGECLVRVRLWGVVRLTRSVVGLVSHGFTIRRINSCSRSHGGSTRL